MAFEFSSVILSTFVGMFGVVIGAVISNYFNQKIARQSAIKDLIFKKRIEYFEKLLDCIEKNIALYKNSVNVLEKNSDKKNVGKILNKMKKDRKKWEILNSPLYLDVKPISIKIMQFVDVEKKIFSHFENLKIQKISKEKFVASLNLQLLQLRTIAGELVCVLRRKLRTEI